MVGGQPSMACRASLSSASASYDSANCNRLPMVKTSCSNRAYLTHFFRFSLLSTTKKPGDMFSTAGLISLVIACAIVWIFAFTNIGVRNAAINQSPPDFETFLKSLEASGWFQVAISLILALVTLVFMIVLVMTASDKKELRRGSNLQVRIPNKSNIHPLTERNNHQTKNSA